MVAQGHGNKSHKLTSQAMWCGLPRKQKLASSPPISWAVLSPVLMGPSTQPFCPPPTPTGLFPRVPDLVDLPQLRDGQGMLTKH